MSASKELRFLAGVRTVAALVALLLILAIGDPQTAVAASLSLSPDGTRTSVGSSDATDFSEARRRCYYRGGGNAAGLAFFGMALGTIGAIAVQQQRNDYYDNYGYTPGYYGGGSYGYGGSPYYGRRYYRRY